MKIFTNTKTNPFITLVLEEMLLKDETINEDILYFYQHDNAIIIGKNQNIYQEVKLEVVEAEKIQVYRRLSGGGAVYHDLGNINFSFITDKDQHSYAKFLNPIIEFFNSLGLQAEYKGRNDILVNGAKVSGNAQIIYKNKIVHHGTILFNANLAKLSEVLIPNKLKIESKGIKSIRQRVTNILAELNNGMTDGEFIKKLIEFFENKYHTSARDVVDAYLNSPEKNATFQQLSKLRGSSEWIFGTNPAFSYENIAKTSGGILKVLANVDKNIIKNIKFEGDFLSQREVEDIEKLLTNVAYDKKEIRLILSQITNLDEYFSNISIDEILELIFGENNV
ncbi:Lipoate-protein ligase A [Mesomycoplasma conjunctivae]|uniref:lipoate--protein ligase n=1 Tax=Mesomycoplasma conjunctivae (strain ATCC 25834 / NCTC 10147 / HRC/581) TaxID=572263 RepID=C5J6I3_MESCH|nr:lipoate--protein ligase [Mesomycoplasma conjunctivae]CAT05075.1 Lipoate-protein ligase A [Mesomycoplasma conjunctivae]VEU66268.1 Lipoate-protein ligase A [Mesomycoplasma conjunctivae]